MWPPALSQVQSMFDARAGTYDLSDMHRWLAGEVAARVTLPRGSTVVDIAAGTSLALRAVADKVSWQGTFVALDNSTAMLLESRARSRSPDALRLICGDAVSPPVRPGCADLVMCISALAYLSDAPAAFRQWRTMLRPGGALLLQAWRRKTMIESRVLSTVGGRYGIQIVDPNELGVPDTLSSLLTEAGFQSIEITEVVWNAPLPLAANAWRAVAGGIWRSEIEHLQADELDGLRADYLTAYEREAKARGGETRFASLIIAARG